MQKELTEQEKQFILQLLSKLNVNPLASDAIDTISLVQNIARKLLTEEQEGEKDHG